MTSSNLKTSINSSHTVDHQPIATLKLLYPPGSKVRIVKDTFGLGLAELHDTYTVVEVKRSDRLHLRDNLGNRFTWPLVDCVHPGMGIEWIQCSSPAFAKGGLVRRILRALVGKRFLRLRPDIRDRILLQQPDLKERIVKLLSSLQP